MTYPVRGRIRYTATFTDSNGAAYDPSGVTVEVTTPDRTATQYTYASSAVTRSAVGVYYYDVDTTGNPGRWSFKAWSPVGSGQAATDLTVIEVTL